MATEPTRSTDVARTRRPSHTRKRRSRGSWFHDPDCTTTDEEILAWITLHGVVTFASVLDRFSSDPFDGDANRVVYRRVAALSRRRLIIRDRNPYAIADDKLHEVLRASREGARRADVGVSEADLVISQLQHTLALVDLTEFLRARHPKAKLITERQLWAEQYHRRYGRKPDPRFARVPDAALRIPVAADEQQFMTVAVELDLSRKERKAMVDMINRYDRMAVDEVWWFVRQVRLSRVRALVAELRAGDRFKVQPWIE